MEWRRLDDRHLRHCWECEGCGAREYVGPQFYDKSGTPECPNCDIPMHYQYSETGFQRHD